MQSDDATLTPALILESYGHAFKKLNGHAPTVRHLGGQWYYINGETVHRLALMAETARLHELLQQKRSVDRGVIHRLIAKLRGI